MKAILIVFFILVSLIIHADEGMAQQAYKRLKWLGNRPIQGPFVHTLGHTSKFNKNLKDKLQNAKFAKVINGYDQLFNKAGRPLRKDWILSSNERGVKKWRSRRRILNSG